MLDHVCSTKIEGEPAAGLALSMKLPSRSAAVSETRMSACPRRIGAHGLSKASVFVRAPLIAESVVHSIGSLG
jgi:hypothetical protein